MRLFSCKSVRCVSDDMAPESNHQSRAKLCFYTVKALLCSNIHQRAINRGIENGKTVYVWWNDKTTSINKQPRSMDMQ